MNFIEINKEDSIITLLEKVIRDIGIDNISIVDYWEADLCAIGISKKEDKEQLVYISTFNQPEGEYYYELEYPSRYKFLSKFNKEGVANYSELLKVIKKHLDFYAINEA